MLGVPSTLIAAALGDELTESEASFRIFLTAGGLAILGLLLMLFTIWWWRGTRPEPPALGPLEVMGDRRWNTATDAERRRMIDLHRPADSFELEGVVAPIPIDLSVLARDLPRDFDDLREPVLALGPSPDEPHLPSVDGHPVDGDLVRDDLLDGDLVDGDLVGDEPLIVAESELNGVQVQPVETEPPPDADATMFQVEAPSLQPVQPNSAVADHVDLQDHHQGNHSEIAVETELDHFDVARRDQSDEPSGELVIDPLLQRTASQD